MIWHGLRKQSHAVAVSVHPPTTALQIAPTRPSNGETPGIAASTDSPVLAVSHPASGIFSWISRILAWENSRRSWDLMSTFEAKAKLGGPRIQAINACRARRGRGRPKTKACERRRVPYRCLIRLVDTSGLEGSGTQWQSGETGGARRADRDTREFFVWTRVNGLRRASASVLDSGDKLKHLWPSPVS